MKKKVYIVMIALVLIIIAEGFVIYSQHTIIKKDKEEKEAHENYEREYIRRLSEQLKLERKGLRHDTRGGDFCPACDGTNIVRIAYGYSPQMSKEEIEEKRVVHGGCVVTEDSKQFVCRDCKYKWGSLDSDNIDEHNGSVLYNATRNEIRIKKVEKMDVASLAIICK